MIGFAMGLAAPITVAMTVYLPPTKNKVCVIQYESLKVENSKCQFKDYEIVEYPMTLLMPVPPNGKKEPNITEIHYQCLHKYECEVRR